MSRQPLAYLDAEFLESAEARPIRILTEYLEPLRRFKAQKIQDTVVFFGSARVDSRERAERALATLRARGEESATEQYEAELRKTRKAVEWARYYEEARELARLLTSWSITAFGTSISILPPLAALASVVTELFCMTTFEALAIVMLPALPSPTNWGFGSNWPFASSTSLVTSSGALLFAVIKVPPDSCTL